MCSQTKAFLSFKKCYHLLQSFAVRYLVNFIFLIATISYIKLQCSKESQRATGIWDKNSIFLPFQNEFFWHFSWKKSLTKRSSTNNLCHTSGLCPFGFRPPHRSKLTTGIRKMKYSQNNHCSIQHNIHI